MVFMYLYTVRVYNWSVGQFSASAVVYSVANTVGLITVIPGFHRCGVSDAVLLFFGTTIQIVTRLIWGFSYEPWMFYLGKEVTFVTIMKKDLENNICKARPSTSRTAAFLRR